MDFNFRSGRWPNLSDITGNWFDAGNNSNNLGANMGNQPSQEAALPQNQQQQQQQRPLAGFDSASGTVNPQQLAATPPYQAQQQQATAQQYQHHHVPVTPQDQYQGQQYTPPQELRSHQQAASSAYSPPQSHGYGSGQQQFHYQTPRQPVQHFQQPSIQPAVAVPPPSSSIYSAPQSTHEMPRVPEVFDLTDSGPKQTRKSTSSTPGSTDDARVNIRQFDPHITLAGGRGAQSAASTNGTRISATDDDSRSATAEADEANQDIGMSRFLQQMHPTVTRESVPSQRKRKSDTAVEDEEDSPNRKKPKSTFSGGAGGGMLGAHMKEQRQKAAAEAGPAPPPIDLTADDDDNDNADVVFMGHKTNPEKHWQNEEVCIGVLPGKANISRIPTYSTKALSSLGGAAWPRTRISFRREASQNMKIELVDNSGKTIGMIEPRLAMAICPLLDGQNVNKLRMVIHLHAWARSKNDHAGQHISKYLGISIVMYAPRRHKLMIGNYLSQKQFWLSSPTGAGLHTGKEVDNPHQPSTFPGRSGQGPRPQSSQPATVLRTQEEMRRETESMFDQLVNHDDLPRMEADDRIIKTPLLDHQKQALYFMTNHEHNASDPTTGKDIFSMWRSNVNKRGQQTWVHVVTRQEVINKPEPIRGGILADMMGLGKTLSILSLIANTKSESMEFGELDPPAEPQYLERNAKTTLIICPKSVMSNWHEQIRAHCKANKLSCYNYHGSGRKRDPDQLATFDIILTTFNTVAADSRAKDRALYGVNWFRVVLDEAHGIRNQSTAVSKACIELAADRRWAVTGTPVQNGLGDLGALIKFLRIQPFDDTQAWNQYIISPLRMGNADVVAHLRLLVDSITLRRMKDKIGLKKRTELSVHLDFPEADAKIYENIATRSSKDMFMMTSGGKAPMKGKAYAHMLRLIDRMRRFCAHGLDMFNEQDRKEIEEGLNPENAIAIDLGDEPGLEAHQFATDHQAYETLHLLMETDADRCDVCGNSLSQKQSKGEDSGEDDEDSSSEEEEEEEDLMGYLTPCFHVICPNDKDKFVARCQETMTVDQRFECPVCTSYMRFGLIELRRSALREYVESKTAAVKKRKGRKIYDETAYNGPSIKVQALVNDLKESAAESANIPEDEPPIRSVVFSQWTSYLDLIEVALEDEGVTFVRLDGSMSVRARTQVMDQFKTDPNIAVILVSIKAGGQGLNFTAANNVYMMEPQYNPGVEQQAIDRVHRLGQKRDVMIKHFIINDTIELKIQALQKRKEDLAKFTLEKKLGKAEEAKKRMEALKDLFR